MMRRTRVDDAIRQALARYAAGEECVTEVEELRRRHPRRLERRWSEMLECVTGSARERLSRLAAAGAEVRSPPPGGVAADMMAEAQVLLATGEPARIRAMLAAVEATGKALPLPDPLPWLRHADPEVRAQVFRILPYVAVEWDRAAEVLRALEQESPVVRQAACQAAARLRLASAIPVLASLLGSADADLVRAAAGALAEMGPRGLEALQAELGASWRSQTAAAVWAALEEARGPHYGHARL